MGQMHGKGAYIWDNGDSYDGEYKVNSIQCSVFHCTIILLKFRTERKMELAPFLLSAVKITLDNGHRALNM